MPLLWPLLFLISHLLSPVAASLFRWPNARIVLEIYYDNNSASASIATPTRPINTYIASTVDFRTLTAVSAPPTPASSVAPSALATTSFTSPAPTAVIRPTVTAASVHGPTATPSFQKPASSSASAAPSVVRESLSPHLAPDHDNIAQAPITHQQDRRLNSSESFMAEHCNEDLWIPFQFPETSPENSFEELFKVDQDCTGSGSELPVHESKPFVANLTDVDQKRLRIITSSRARHFGSVVIPLFRGYTIDLGLTRLPEYWSPLFDPPLINDLGNEWKAAVASKHREAAKFDAETQESKAARLVHESETATLRRRNTELSDLIADGIEKKEQLDRNLKDAQNKNSLADFKLNNASKKYVRAAMYEFKTRYARSTTDPTSTAVALVISPLYPPLPPTPFALLEPTTWSPKVAWKIARGKAWSLYQTFCLRIAILALFCALYMCEHEHELPPPPPLGRNIFPGSFVSSGDDTQESTGHINESSFNHSLPSIKPHRKQMQDRGTQTDVPDSGRSVTPAASRNTRSSVRVPSRSDSASTTIRAPPRTHAELVVPGKSNKALSPLPLAKYSFTPPSEWELAHRRVKGPSPSLARFSDSPPTPAPDKAKETVVNASQQTEFQLSFLSVAGSYTAREETQDDPKAPMVPVASAAVFSLLTDFQSAATTLRANVAPTPAFDYTVEKMVEPIHHTLALTSVDEESFKPVPSISYGTTVEPINSNPFPYYSVATGYETNAMPLSMQQTPTFEVQPIASTYTFFTQPITAQPLAPSNMIPLAPFFYQPLTSTVYEDIAPIPFPDVAEFPFRGAYLPWTAPKQSAADDAMDIEDDAMDIEDDVFASPIPQAANDSMVVDPVSLDNSFHFEPMDAMEEPYGVLARLEQATITSSTESVLLSLLDAIVDGSEDMMVDEVDGVDAGVVDNLLDDGKMSSSDEDEDEDI
ncbi:hypothetical protein QFC21_005535 [Naganishia friedmannii]|uniref:Uncharacterized protein n=1 Tax=Naganishia friedmannii TaxID=89922 RepID=A0ACC2V8H1_9TREE|nr:hypothetical protein QFC21_005535 [Naganishia friedmannii]